MKEVSETWRKQIEEKLEQARVEEAEAARDRDRIQAEVQQLQQNIQVGQGF